MASPVAAWGRGHGWVPTQGPLHRPHPQCLIYCHLRSLQSLLPGVSAVHLCPFNPAVNDVSDFIVHRMWQACNAGVSLMASDPAGLCDSWPFAQHLWSFASALGQECHTG